LSIEGGDAPGWQGPSSAECYGSKTKGHEHERRWLRHRLDSVIDSVTPEGDEHRRRGHVGSPAASLSSRLMTFQALLGSLKAEIERLVDDF
jgi:hypothetical protein